jgi:peptidylprolyl isomerase
LDIGMGDFFYYAFGLFVLFVVGRRIMGHFAAKENIVAGAAFLAENKQKEGVEETASGLQYEWLEKSDSERKPNAKSKVEVHYHGTLLDGSVFDSSVVRGKSIVFGLNQVIRGWTEGVQLMNEGSKMRLYVPSHLAYGNRAAGAIKPGSTLIFDVELLSIKN